MLWGMLVVVVGLAACVPLFSQTHEDKSAFWQLIRDSGKRHIGGDIEGARAQTAAAIDLAGRQGWSEELIYALNNSGKLALQAGQHDQAREVFHEGERLSSASRELIQHFRAMTGLVTAYVHSGDRVDAGQWYQRAVAASKQVEIAEDPEIAPALVELAQLPFNARQHAAAEQLYVRAIRLADRYASTKAYFLVNALDGLGQILLETGRTTEANRALERGFRFSNELNGRDHADTLRIAAKLALAWAGTGRLDQAAVLARENTSKLEDRFGPRHVQLAIAMLAEAYIAVQKRNHTHAARLCERGLSILTAVYPPDHAQVIVAKRQTASVYAAMKRHAQAKRMQTEADEAEQRSFTRAGKKE
jgi:tetratricopeptide (TPR) repeat protein